MDYNSKGDDENDRNKVRVLTAGGVASTAATSPSSSSRNKKKKQHKKKQAPKEQSLVNEQAVTSTSTSTATGTSADDTKQEAQNDWDRPEVPVMAHALEFEEDEWDSQQEDEHAGDSLHHNTPYTDDPKQLDSDLAASTSMDSSTSHNNNKYPVSSQAEKANADTSSNYSDIVWLTICFLGIMASFVCYGLLLEYTTSGGRNLHELSFLFVTSGLYTLTAAAGRYVRDETPSTIPPARFALLGLTSMGSTFCSVRSLRYVLS